MIFVKVHVLAEQQAKADGIILSPRSLRTSVIKNGLNLMAFNAKYQDIPEVTFLLHTSSTVGRLPMVKFQLEFFLLFDSAV